MGVTNNPPFTKKRPGRIGRFGCFYPQLLKCVKTTQKSKNGLKIKK